MLGNFINTTPGCIPAEASRLYRRILACLLVGNTDAHFKNFAMLHTRDGLRLTPSYDLVAANRYNQFQEIALSIGGAKKLKVYIWPNVYSNAVMLKLYIVLSK